MGTASNMCDVFLALVFFFRSLRVGFSRFFWCMVYCFGFSLFFFLLSDIFSFFFILYGVSIYDKHFLIYIDFVKHTLTNFSIR